MKEEIKVTMADNGERVTTRKEVKVMTVSTGENKTIEVGIMMQMIEVIKHFV
jgi:hypothetical protein